MIDALKTLLTDDDLAAYAEAQRVVESFPSESTSGTGILTSDLASLLQVIDRLAFHLGPRDGKIDPKMRSAMIAYARDHKAAGDFVMACFRNDLVQAATRADPSNLVALPAIMRFIYNELPSICWGSEAKVDAWLAVKGPTELPDLRAMETEARL